MLEKNNKMEPEVLVVKLHENTQDDQLFAAKNGKDLVQPIRNK